MRAAEPPAWRFERRLAPFLVECPACGAVARPWWVGAASCGDVRCSACNERFPYAPHTVATTGRGARGAGRRPGNAAGGESPAERRSE